MVSRNDKVRWRRRDAWRILSAPLGTALAGLCAFLAACGGCNVGPDYKPPTTTMPAAWGESATSRPATQPTTQPARLTGWWKAFGDPTLDRLVGLAVRGNINLRQAEQRVLEARAQRGVVAANEWPKINADGSYDRMRFSRNGLAGSAGSAAGAASGAGGGGGGSFGLAHSLYQVGFDATWELDVFGKTRRNVEAADASIAAAIEDRGNVLVTLLGDLALNYIEFRSFQRQVRLAEETLRAQRETLALTRARSAAGAATDLDVAQAEAQVATTAAQVPTLETAVRQRMHQLGVLAGQQPMALAALAAEESPIPAAPPEVPAGIPSDLLRQRPDIRRAERQLAAATAQIGVAVADLFPRFTLTGNVAMQSTKPRTLLNGGSFLMDVGPSMTWPVFDAGAIRANIRVKDAQQAQAAATYEQTVLTALQEVEDALVAYLKEHAHRKALTDAVDANRRALDLATKLFTHGRTDFLNVLDAQRALYASQNALVQSDQAISADLVAIYKALGGGWDGHEGE